MFSNFSTIFDVAQKAYWIHWRQFFFDQNLYDFIAENRRDMILISVVFGRFPEKESCVKALSRGNYLFIVKTMSECLALTVSLMDCF